MTMNEAQRSRQSARLAAARDARSRSRSSGRKLRPMGRASEHRHLMTKDGVLELELCDDQTPGEQPDEAHEHEVGEGPQGGRDATCQRQSERKRVLEPHRPSQNLHGEAPEEKAPGQAPTGAPWLCLSVSPRSEIPLTGSPLCVTRPHWTFLVS